MSRSGEKPKLPLPDHPNAHSSQQVYLLRSVEGPVLPDHIRLAGGRGGGGLVSEVERVSSLQSSVFHLRYDLLAVLWIFSFILEDFR